MRLRRISKSVIPSKQATWSTTKHAHGLQEKVETQCLGLVPRGADPGLLGDRGGIGGGAPFRPPVVFKIALQRSPNYSWLPKPGRSLSTAGRMQVGVASREARGGDSNELLFAAVSSLEGGEIIDANEQLASVARESERFAHSWQRAKKDFFFCIKA